MVDGDYTQRATVLNLHSAPRFGHTSNLAAVASSDPGPLEDYRRGVIAFSILMLSLLSVWGAILVTLKFRGPDRVGCAAGGDVVDVSYWRKERHKDKEAVSSILRRSWRVQTVFFVASILLMVAAALFLRNGIFRISDSLQEIQEINNMIGAIVFRALGITKSLQRAQNGLQSSDVQLLLDMESICPNMDINASTSVESWGIDSIHDSLRSVLHNVTHLMKEHVHGAHDGLVVVGEAALSVSETMDDWFANQWLPKLFVMLLFVVTIFLVGGLCLSRSNVVHHPTRRVLACVLVPAFALLLVTSVVTTCTFGILAVVDADFCAGGEAPGSPIGTIEDIVTQHSVSEEDILFRSFNYYMSSCISQSPFEFLKPLETQLLIAVQQANSVVSFVGEVGASTINDACSSEITPVIFGLTVLAENLDLIRENVRATTELTSCMTVAPVLRKVFYGPICDEAINGLTWAFATSFVICIVGLTMLSVRAALYNATVRRPRKLSERKRLREWLEYKHFMAQFYDDTDGWTAESVRVKGDEKDDLGLQASSFETEITGQPSADSDDCEGDSLAPAFPGSRSIQEPGVGDLEYVTPRHPIRFRLPRMDEFEFAYRTRNMNHLLDSEIEPLSPIFAKPPEAPRKSVVRVPRTSQGTRKPSSDLDSSNVLV